MMDILFLCNMQYIPGLEFNGAQILRTYCRLYLTALDQ